eukprot:6261907-Prymnesium_polylepis.1
MYVECDQYGSQARFLLAKLNPSVTHNSAQNAGQGGDFLFTDDVSLQVCFTAHPLKHLAAESLDDWPGDWPDGCLIACCLVAWLLGCLAAWLLGCLVAWLLGC